jgi:serine protease
MKRTSFLLATLTFFVTTAASGADTQRYLVATKRPTRTAIVADVKQMLGEDLESRAVAAFESFTGFAANLTSEEVAALRKSHNVRWVEPVLPRHAFEQARNPLKQTIPLSFGNIFARQAQLGVMKGAVNVVVIDTGVDYTHADLKPAYAGGWNVLTKLPDPYDDDGHGTHVAGTIAAADNQFGVVGVAPKVRLWGVKMLDGQGNGTTEGLIDAMDWVVAQKEALGGNWVVNLSLGAMQESEGEREAFQRIADKGILVIAASGNFSTPNAPAAVAFPAAYPSVIAVGATGFDNKHAYFSNQGPELDLSAPGVDVLSTLRVGTNEISYVADDGEPVITDALTGSKRGVVSAEWVFCGTGKIGDFPSSVAGRIALVQRGDKVTFADKTRRAKEAGAIAVIIFDTDTVPGPRWTLYSNDEDRAYDWPISVRLNMAAAQALRARGPRPITLAFTADDYGEKSGTSMSCPHVVGAAALAWSLAPEATAQQVVHALLSTATDLGDPGPDPLYGVGLLNANAAARLLAPTAFSSITTGRPIGYRGRK